MRYKPLTDTELTKVLKHLVILTDTAEKENSHIIDYFTKKKIAFKKVSLSEGDYSGMIACNEETEKLLGISKDLYFNDVIVIERKAHLDELCGNLKNTGTKERQRFEFELTRIKLNCANKFLLIEDNDGEENIRKKNYMSEFEPKALYNSLKSFEARYKCPIVFNSKTISPGWIYSTIERHIREELKRGDYMEVEHE
jgi:hypothetical protein